MAVAQILLQNFNDPGLDEQDLLHRLAWLRDVIAPRLERYLGYYRNPMTDLSSALACPANSSFMVRPYRQYQEIGLPARITGFRRGADGSGCPTGTIDVQRKEVVIENDIGWRIDTLVDFAADRLPAINSAAKDPEQGARLTPVITAILESAAGCGRSGILGLLQELVLQGAIAGSAWIHIRPSAELLTRLGGGGGDISDIEVSRWLRLEVFGARHICPLRRTGGNPCSLDGSPAYVAMLRESSEVEGKAHDDGGFLRRVWSWIARPHSLAAPEPQEFSFDLFGAAYWQRYQRGVLVEEAANPLEIVPFVRYENAPDPAAGTRAGAAGSGAVNVGVGDVEPLIGLQDELNVRLSDRAYRVTMSSFRMFLGKGIDDFIKRPIGPGQMWGTDNLDASIEAFGGDQKSPSEESHINEVREALDKVSGVSPVAAGVLRGKLGNLTSAIALRLTLVALLARTERKRAALTQTLAAVVRMTLEILDKAGVVNSAPEDRGIDVNWPTALPESDMDRLAEAQAKVALGVPRAVVLTELGYGEVTEAQRTA